MLNPDRVSRIFNDMEKDHLSQILITDPPAVYYLTGKWFAPGERFLGMLLSREEEPVLFVNELFQFDEDLGMKVSYFSDTDDILPLLTRKIQPDKPLGIDKTMAARFLLPLIHSQAASSFVNGSVYVDHIRSCKDAEEIQKMKRSSSINDAAMKVFKTLVHEGVTEKEIADQMLGIYQSLGAEGYSFDPIVSFGAHAADPHHSPDETLLKEGDAVLFDVGCRADGYCSDMTRTYFYRLLPDAEIVRIYELVHQANLEAEKMLQPGIPLKKVDHTARSIITDGGYGPNFTHRLGHFIGIEDHETGDVSSVNEHPAEEGNIFSIEPGIYVPRLTGVRIEDLVLITKDGHEVLNAMPKELEIIG